MLGFAIVDRRPGAGATAVWLTGRVEAQRVGHTNAVVVQDADEQHDVKVKWLIGDRSVVLTPGTVPPVPFAHALGIDEFAELVEQTTVHQRRIAQAVEDYAARTRNKNIGRPEFPPAPERPDVDQIDSGQRALSLANYVSSAWAYWLATEEQRRRRVADPRSGHSPWIMPEELGNPVLAEFPAEFARRVLPQPVR